MERFNVNEKGVITLSDGSISSGKEVVDLC